VESLSDNRTDALPSRRMGCHGRAMMPRAAIRAALLISTAALALAGCKREKLPQSLVGDFPVPGTYALAGDTITVWKRVRRPDGAWRFHSFSITPGGTVEYLEEPERVEAPTEQEDAADLIEKRKGFVLPTGEFEAIRSGAAQLRPAALGPHDPIGGYAGEVVPKGCSLDTSQPRLAGINFLNRGNWGSFALQSGCQSQQARAASEVMNGIFDRLERAESAAPR
jgi:hypothetical protein